MDDKFLPKLSQNLLEILDDGDDDEYYDITIEVGNDPDVQIFRAHMVILNKRSPYLREILTTKSDGTSVRKLSNISPGIFQIILRYIYSGRISLLDRDTSDVVKILIAANELGLPELIPHLQSFLIKHKSNWMEQNFNFVYKTSFENDSFSELQNYCTNIMLKNPVKIFQSNDFTSISEEFLITLIENDNLQMKVVQVWEHVLKWGIAQNFEHSTPDPSNLSKDDLNTLKNTLQKCIPYINFFNLASREFLDKVLPYKRVLPKELYKKLLKVFLNHNREPQVNTTEPQVTIDSQIITSEHAKLISKWIDRLTITDEINNSHEFKLIFRDIQNRFRVKEFHNACDNKSRTLVIVKVKNSDEILGGYNPIVWTGASNRCYGVTEDSFIFSFRGNNNINNYILSRIQNSNNAINNWSNYGPSFGNGDLMIYGSDKNNNHCRKNSYEEKIRETENKFFIEKYEIFQIL